MNQQWSIQLVLALLKRNWWIMLLLAIIFTPIFYFITPLLPRKYTSDTLVVVRFNVEGPANSNKKEALVKETQNRINVIKNLILSRTRLTELVKEFDLYRDLRESYPIEYTLDKVKSGIHVKIFNNATGFQVSFSGPDPQKVRKVTDELANMFVEEHLKFQQREYIQVQFAKQQLQIQQKKVERLDRKIKEFKTEHDGELPEQLDNNLTAKNTFLRLLDTNAQYLYEAERKENIGANEFRNLLELAIKQIETSYNRKKIVASNKDEQKKEEQNSEQQTPTQDPKTAQTEEERLLAKRRQLQDEIEQREKLKARFLIKHTPLHPTVGDLEEEIKLLKEELAELGGESLLKEGDPETEEVYYHPPETRKRMKKIIEDLRGLKDNYEKYLLLQSKIAAIEFGKITDEVAKDLEKLTKRVRELEKKAFENIGVVLRDSPELLKKAKEQHQLHIRASTLRMERKKLWEELNKYQARIDNTPKVEQALLKLRREHAENERIYEELSRSTQNIILDSSVREKFKDVEFVVLDQAYLPVAKFAIFYKVFFLAGTVFGITLGLAIAVLRHLLFPRVDDMITLKSFVSERKIFTIPKFKLPKSKMKQVSSQTMLESSSPAAAALPDVDDFLPETKEEKLLSEQNQYSGISSSEGNLDALEDGQKPFVTEEMSRHRQSKSMLEQEKNLQMQMHYQGVPVDAFSVPLTGRWDMGVPFASMMSSSQVEIVPITNLTTFFATSTPIANLYRKLRFQIFPKHSNGKNRRVMFTSAVEQEGKTTTSFNVAGAIATGIKEKAIWIDCNLDHPLEYGGKRYERGLANVLAGEMELKDAILKTQLDRLMILPAGETYLNPLELLASDAMVKLVDELNQKYPDHLILFDAMSILSTSEPSLLASLSDQIVFVIRAHKTSPKVVQKALQQIDQEKISTYVYNCVDPMFVD